MDSAASPGRSDHVWSEKLKARKMNKSKEALDEFWLWLLECLGGVAVFLLIALPYAIAAFAMQWANDNYGFGAMAMVMFVCIGVLLAVIGIFAGKLK
jgi:hypothetical protein